MFSTIEPSRAFQELRQHQLAHPPEMPLDRRVYGPVSLCPVARDEMALEEFYRRDSFHRMLGAALAQHLPPERLRQVFLEHLAQVESAGPATDLLHSVWRSIPVEFQLRRGPAGQTLRDLHQRIFPEAEATEAMPARLRERLEEVERARRKARDEHRDGWLEVSTALRAVAVHPKAAQWLAEDPTPGRMLDHLLARGPLDSGHFGQVAQFLRRWIPEWEM